MENIKISGAEEFKSLQTVVGGRRKTIKLRRKYRRRKSRKSRNTIRNRKSRRSKLRKKFTRKRRC